MQSWLYICAELCTFYVKIYGNNIISLPISVCPSISLFAIYISVVVFLSLYLSVGLSVSLSLYYIHISCFLSLSVSVSLSVYLILYFIHISCFSPRLLTFSKYLRTRRLSLRADDRSASKAVDGDSTRSILSLPLTICMLGLFQKQSYIGSVYEYVSSEEKIRGAETPTTVVVFKPGSVYHCR